jgi:hypothetical protein
MWTLVADWVDSEKTARPYLWGAGPLAHHLLKITVMTVHLGKTTLKKSMPFANKIEANEKLVRTALIVGYIVTVLVISGFARG